jgi:Bacterial Ig domain/Calx-beta domain
MSNFPRAGISTTISTVTRTQRFLIITFGFVLVLGGVALSKSPAVRERLGLSPAPKPSVSRQTTLSAPASKRFDLLRTLSVNGSSRQPTSLALLVPSVSATKSDSLFTDVDGDLQADPGDTLKYTVNITASGSDATGVTFTDTVDPNTAFVPGSLRATPVAVDDSYAATGNIRISVAAPGVLGNDFNGVPSATITAPPSTSTNGGDVTLNADGSFTYNPPAGFEGTDTFSYTLTNSAGSNSATVTINVSGMIWFVNNTASCPCDGRLTNPFNTLASFAAANNGAGNNPAANDNIFLYESASDYAGPVTLLNGQRFLGQDATASLSAMTGLTPPAGSDPLPTTNSGNGTIVNITAGNAITVASGNTLRGFTGGDSTTDISGIGFGTLTISDVTLNGTGQALNLTTGTLAATFGSISSTNSGTTGISLTSVAGSLTTPTTTITNPTGIGISVGTSSATLSFGNTSSTSSGGTGVSLLTNTGAITFGALDISPDANQKGLVATDNSNTITSTSGTISATSATAVEITRGSGTTPLVISQTSVSSSGGSANGIILSNTTGSFTVVGTGTAGSGGTIASKTGADGSSTQGTGIFLNNVQNISLDRMQLNDFQNFGVRGSGVTGFTLNNSTINGLNGTTEAGGFEEGAIRFDNLVGSGSISNSSISGSYSTHIRVQNTSGVLNRLVIDNCILGPLNDNATHGGSSVLFDAASGATFNFTLSSSTLSGSRSHMLSAIGHGGSHMDAVVLENKLQNADAFILSGASGILLQGGDLGVADLTFNISCNKISTSAAGGAKGPAINIFKATNTTSGSFVGTVGGNAIGVVGQTLSGAANSAPALWIQDHGAGTFTTLIQNNTIVEYGEEAIDLARTSGGSTLNASVFGNVVTPNPDNAFAGVTIEQGAVGSDSGTMNLVMGNATAASPERNDFSNGDPFDFSDVQVLRAGSSSTVLNLSRNGSAAATVTGVIQDDNIGGAATAVFIPTTGNMNLVNTLPPLPPAVAGCTLPALMSAPPAEEQMKAGSKAITGDSKGTVDDILTTTRGEDAEGKNVAKLTQGDLNLMTLAAIERWRQAGISAGDLQRLQSVTFEITDLPEGQRASVTSTSVKIDETAAKYGWYTDASPMEDSEFDVPVPNRELQTTELSPAFGRIDLLTVVMRELGSVYLQGKERIPKQLLPLMEGTLSPAIRRLPNSRDLTGSPVEVSGRNRSGSEKSLVSRISKPSALRAATGVSSSPVSIRKAAFNPGANRANSQSSRLMNHAPGNRTTTGSLSSMLADVMLNIGTLPAGESVTITFNVTVNDPFTGAVAQVSNQGTVSGSNFADVLTDDPTVGGTADPTVTPIDLPDVSVAVSPASVAEDGATNLVYTFTRNGSTASALTVNFSIGGTANFGASPNDYTQTGAATFTPPTGTVTFGAGNSTATVTVNPETDTTVETDETVVLTVTSGIGYDVGSPSSASGTITNDDADVSVAVSPASVAEDGATNLVYTFTRTGATSGALTVNFSVGGTANFGASPNDYTQTGATTFTATTGSVTFGAGNSTATVTVNPETDTTIEADETVILTLTSGAGYNVSSPSSATGTITNDDADVSVAVSPASVAEDGATNLVYTFTRTGFTAGALTVNFSVGGTATFGVSPDDYTQTGATTFTTTSGSVTFSPGSSTATVTVNPETDTTAEADETVIISLTAGASYNVVSPSSATGTILNDDTLVSVAVSPSSTAEGGANLVYTFTRTGPTTSALTVNLSVGGSASFPADYSQSGATTFTPPTATVTFAVGSSTKTVTVTPLTDCTVEGSETVVFTVQPGTGYGVGSPSSATGTITNTPDSGAPTITLIPNVNMTLWPPNHQYESIAVTDFVASASDDCDPTVNVNSVYILKITSDEPENSGGDGNTLNDIVIGASCKTAQLRSERQGSGDGRVYTITFKVKDSVGNFTTATATVTVRKNPNQPAVDSGTAYTVNSVCP